MGAPVMTGTAQINSDLQFIGGCALIIVILLALILGTLIGIARKR